MARSVYASLVQLLVKHISQWEEQVAKLSHHDHIILIYSNHVRKFT